MSVNQRISITKPSRTRRIRADLSLLFVTFIWGFAFAVQRYAAPQVGIFLFNGLRFALGALVIVPITLLTPSSDPALPGINRANIGYVLLAGLLLAAGAALQQAGLIYTTAGNAGFITGLYVIFVPIFMALGMHHRPKPVIWVAAVLALIGLYLLSASGPLRPNIGDGLVLVSAVVWSLHVILIGWLVARMDILKFAFGQYLVCALLSIAAGLVFEGKSMADMRGAWWAIVFTGAISVAVGYTLQASAQRFAPPADAAIILSVEAVFAAFFGWLLLGEHLTFTQIMGCGIILFGMLLSQSHLFFNKNSA